MVDIRIFEYLRKTWFNTPKNYPSLGLLRNDIDNNIINFPIIVKPRYGCGSISVSVAYDIEDLKYLTKKIIKSINSSYLKYESASSNDIIIYQEYLDGKEYGADVINDLSGSVRKVIIREKIDMRSGETDIARIVEHTVLEEVLIKLGNKTRHIANLDCDIFIVNDKPYILEMNARFGGGYPFSHLAGCDLPTAICRWVEGLDVSDEMLSVEHNITGFKELLITKNEAN